MRLLDVKDLVGALSVIVKSPRTFVVSSISRCCCRLVAGPGPGADGDVGDAGGAADHVRGPPHNQTGV